MKLKSILVSWSYVILQQGDTGILHASIFYNYISLNRIPATFRWEVGYTQDGGINMQRLTLFIHTHSHQVKIESPIPQIHFWTVGERGMTQTEHKFSPCGRGENL